MSNGSKIPRHYQIAIDIAQQIRKRILKEGDRVSGRSLASTEYNTSTETMRKAFGLLNQHGVLFVKEKSKSIIGPRDAASEFLRLFKSEHNLYGLLKKVDQLLEQRSDLDKELKNTFKKVKYQTSKIKKEIVIDHFLITIHSEYFASKKSISELDLFSRTGGTLFGILTKDNVISNIHMDYIIQDEDVLYISGDDNVAERSIIYIKNGI